MRGLEKDLCSIVKDAGIVGAGGAGFPTHVKLNAKAEYVIVNGAECEPLLRVDQNLMAIEARTLLEGLKLIKENVPFCKTVVGGAVLTEEYAEKIGADKYAKDAMEAIRFANEIN